MCFRDEVEQEPLFLKVRSRDTVLVGKNEICKVLSFVGGFRDPDALKRTILSVC